MTDLIQTLIAKLDKAKITVDNKPVTEETLVRAIDGMLMGLAQMQQENAALWALVKMRAP